MKKLMLALTMALSFGAISEEAKDPCIGTKAIAQAIMQTRQAGVDASSTVAVFAKSKDFNIYMRIITDAYSRPQFNTELNKIRVTAEFANQYYIACWSAAA